MMANTYEFEVPEFLWATIEEGLKKTQESGHAEVGVTCEDPLESHMPQVHSGYTTHQGHRECSGDRVPVSLKMFSAVSQD